MAPFRLVYLDCSEILLLKSVRRVEKSLQVLYKIAFSTIKVERGNVSSRDGFACGGLWPGGREAARRC